MYISKLKAEGLKRPNYRVLESYREGREVHKRYIVNLGRHSTVSAAYQAELAKYLRASAKMERLEYALLSMREKGA